MARAGYVIAMCRFVSSRSSLIRAYSWTDGIKRALIVSQGPTFGCHAMQRSEKNREMKRKGQREKGGGGREETIGEGSYPF